MSIFNRNARRQYESARKELRDILIPKKVTNKFDQVVYLDYVPWETFHLEKDRLFALYKYGTRCSPALADWTKKELEDRANNFVANVIGNEPVYGDGASSGPHHNRGGRITKILAILLYCNCSSSPKLMPWKHLSMPATGPDAQRSGAPPLRDRNLPFRHDVLNQYFGEEVAKDFEYEQTRFVSLVLSKGDTHRLHSTDSLHKLLPYKSEKLVGKGTFGAVYETVIFRGHFSEGEDNVNFHPRAVARKDFKLESSSTPPSSWKEEWSIYCALQEGLPPTLRENIIKSHSCVVQPGDQGEAGTVSVFMELAQSDLRKLVERHCRDRKKDSAKVHVSKMTAVARTLSALHNDIQDSNGERLSCYHLDLKPENILVCARSKGSPLDLDAEQPVLANSYDLKVADFSVSKLARLPSRPADGRTFDNRLHYSSRGVDDQYGSRAKASTACRVGDFSTCMPPEALPQTTPTPTEGISSNKHVDAKADVWAFGCVLCIFVAWIHRGPDGVSQFCQKRREEFQNRGADRFVGIAQDGTYRLNERVVRWFNKLVDDYRQRDDPDYGLYRALWHLLSNHVLAINPAQRYTMKQLAQALVEITQESANNAAEQSFDGTMSSNPSTTSPGARSSSITTAVGPSTSDWITFSEPEVPVLSLVQRNDQPRIFERPTERVSNATPRFWHGRGKFKDASRLRPTTPEDSLSSHSTDLIQPAVDRHPSNFTLDLSGDLVSCAVSPDQRHLVFLYRSSIKVFNVMSLCQSLRPGVSIKAPPSYIVESIEPIRTFSLGANHLWAVIDKDRCKVNSESLASS
jgi:serine/threonine protein kinase